MVRIDSGDSGTCGYVTMSAGVLSGDNEELLSLNQVHYHSAVNEQMVRDESLISNEGDDTMSTCLQVHLQVVVDQY